MNENECPVSKDSVLLYTALEYYGDPKLCTLTEDDFSYEGSGKHNGKQTWFWTFPDPESGEEKWVWCQPYENSYIISGFSNKKPK